MKARAFCALAFVVLTRITPQDALADETNFPPVSLRGFGILSGELTPATTANSKGSVLTIQCEDAEKAKLVLAKFLSDQTDLPGVEKESLKVQQWGYGSVLFGGHPVSGYEVKEQGHFSGLRMGAKVKIFSSLTHDGLVALLNGNLKGATDVASDAEVKVPMWLDRWDQHGFRFYYWAEHTPPDKTVENYDFKNDFTYAQDHGVGMLFWDNLSRFAGAEGETDYTTWDWAENWSRQDNLPTAINLAGNTFDIPLWVGNRYRESLMQTMPGYLGDSFSVAAWRGTVGKVGEVVWGVSPAGDAMLAALQKSVRHFNDHPNVVSWLEPHGELGQAGDDFMGYGPACDVTFRNYLQGRYANVGALSQAWYGKNDAIKAWDEIRVPELASFLGWSADALDLAGAWRIFNPGSGIPPEWFAPAFDDATWLTVTAPGDDRNFFLPKKTAVYRRTFDVPADWLAKHPKVWLYLWDLNNLDDDKLPTVVVYLNGQKVGDSAPSRSQSHWMSLDATTLLKPGSNQVTLVLPSGFIGYRIYLSGSEPKQYPNLGEGTNTQWVDLVGWRQKTRVDSARRGMEMIREVDPNRGITLMAPGYAADGVKGLAADYGGEFHDTGFMGGSWADLLPSMMRSSNLPYSVEPGNGAASLPEFQSQMGRFLTEGVQGIDYFIHIGDVIWHPEIKKYFEDILPIIHLVGKMHVPKADMAFLWSTRADSLTGFPWTNDVNANVHGGWACNILMEQMLLYCPRDVVTEGDFSRGNASAYKVVLDTNSTIMDDEFISRIEKYVSDGGVFITFVSTGRHTPTQKDTWPISRLTGYDVMTQERYDVTGHGINYQPGATTPESSSFQTVQPAPGQTVYKSVADWMNSPWISGLRMKKHLPDTQDLCLWKDGSVAIGMRKIGKGAIIEFGCKGDPQIWLTMDINAFKPILEMAGVRTNSVDSHLDDPKALNHTDYYLREFVSNNGLYDVSMIWNPSPTKSIDATIKFKDSQPTTAHDVATGQDLPMQNGTLTGYAVAPLQTRAFLTARNMATQAPADWFDLQRNWWRASLPVSKPFPPVSDRFVRDMNDDWTWHPMEDKDDPTPWIVPGFNDSAWTKLSVGAWNTAPNGENVHHAFMRHTFTVPAEWQGGRVELWIQAYYDAFSRKGRIWLDGKPVTSWISESTISGDDLGGVFKPGTTHVLAAELMGQGQLLGILGNVWLRHVPQPVSSLDLSGQWTLCKDDVFHDTGTVTLPGHIEAKSVWRTINVPKENEGKNVMLMIDGDYPFDAVVNGTLVKYGDVPKPNTRVGLNITPFVHFGQDNRIQLIGVYNHATPTRLALDFFDPALYP